MSGKIDLHCHTKYSDGNSDIMTMALKAKELGFQCLCVTDHDIETSCYWRGYEYVSAMKDSLPLPVIVGCEISTPFGHHLLYGKKAIKNFFRMKSKLEWIGTNFDASLWVQVFRDYVLNKATVNWHAGVTIRNAMRPVQYALVLNHPRSTSDFYDGYIPDAWYKLCAGFEVQNGMSKYDEKSPEVVEVLRKKMPCAIEFRNSDAHCPENMGRASNECERKVVDENSLLQWIDSLKSNKQKEG